VGELVLQVGVLVGVLVIVAVQRAVDRRPEPSLEPSGRRAKPVLWVVWGIVAAGCLVLITSRTRNVVLVVLLLMFLVGLWAFGGTHRVPVLVRWGIGLLSAAGSLIVAFVVLGLVVALGRGWFGGAEDSDETADTFSFMVSAPIDGPLNYDLDQPPPPALLLDKDDAATLGVEPRIEGGTTPGNAAWTIHTDLVQTDDVDHCFGADVLFEGTEEVAIEAGTCVSDQNPIQTELPS
jgi:hypothetical protein